MSLCDGCFDPGACCRNFVIGGFQKTFHVDEGNAVPQAWIDAARDPRGRAFPFIATGPDTKRWKDENGREYAAWRFGCSKLGANGRCGAYEDRPTICRAYVAGMDEMCVHFRGAEGGEGRAVDGYDFDGGIHRQMEGDDPGVLEEEAWDIIDAEREHDADPA